MPQLYNNLTASIPICKGLKQGCCMSPILLNIYLDQALYNCYRKCVGMGIPVGLFTLSFADDQIALTQDQEDMGYIIRKLKEYEH